MIDIGINLFSSQFDRDREQVLRDAYTAGITDVLLTGTDLDNSWQALEFCQQQRTRLEQTPKQTMPQCYSTAGIHPHYAQELPTGWQQQLAQICAAPTTVALGEMGLDYYRNLASPQAQQACFSAQAELGNDLSMPLFVHDRDASTDCLRLLCEQVDDFSQVVVHCFTGNQGTLTAYLETGCYIGITGWLCDTKRGVNLRDIVTTIPLSRLLVETDSPYLRPDNAPSPQSGKRRRNTPALLPYVIETLAQCYQESPAHIAQTTRANAQRLFRLPVDVGQ